MLLTKFGFKNIDNFPQIPTFFPKSSYQSYLTDLTEQFVCPISKIEYKSKIEHLHKCKYRYCKKGWRFR